MFKIRIPKETEEAKAAGFLSRIAAISNSDLNWVVVYLRKNMNKHDPSSYSSSISQREKVLNDIQRRRMLAKDIGDSEMKNSLSFPLSIFACLICKYRKPTQLEQFLAGLEMQTLWQLNTLHGLVEETRRKAERDKVADFAALVHRLHAIPPVSYPSSNFYQNEHACLVMKGVRGVSCSKVGESFFGGTLVVTNRRVFFMSPTHNQVYRLQNLIEYSSDWDYYDGTIKLSTTERRSERYQMPGVWKAAFVISFFCDPMFRQAILQGSEAQAKAAVLSKVEASIMRGPCEVKTDERRHSTSDSEFRIDTDKYKVGDMVYTDVSHMGPLRGMLAAFMAGLHGEQIITGFDRTMGIWDQTKRSANGEKCGYDSGGD